MTHSRRKGFTLLELLIVITILAILTLVVVLFINPVEILKKSRDVQRMSDLDILRTALNLYLQDSTSNTLGSTGTYKYIQSGSSYNYCTASASASETTGEVKSSLAFATAGLQTFTTNSAAYGATTTADLALNTGKGWIPYVDFTGVRTGAPVSKLPVDPVNTGNTGSVAAGTPGIDSLYYRYACKTDNTFELDTTLESVTYGPTSTTDNKAASDGGNAVMRYEVGTNLRVLSSAAPIL